MQYTSVVIALLASAGLAQAGVVKARADCQAQADACRVAPGANQSFCSAQLSSCLGYNPYANNTAAATTATTPVVRYTTVIQSSYVTYCPSPTTIVQGTQTYTVTAATTLTITNCPCTVTKAVPQATGVATPSTCVATCQAQYDTCRVGTPGMSGNQASCLAAFSQCLGFVPTNAAGQFTTPTACATSAASTRAATTAAATTAASGTCVQNCQAAYDTCRVGTPGMSGNQASCLAAFSQCLGFVPTNAAGQFTTPTACATSAASTRAATTAAATTAASGTCVQNCQAAYDTCRVGTPGMSGNQASCLAAFSQCLGFVPTNAAGQFTSPTACATSAASTSAATTAPAATTSAAANACVSSCQATYNTCRVGTPGMSGNQASCLAAYASCLGFLPTNAAGSLTSPTACSTTAAASTAAGRTSTVALTTTVRPAATVGVPVCQIGDGQIQNSGACTTVPGSSSTVVIPATTMTIPVVVSTTLASTTAPVASVPVASSPAASTPATSVPATSAPVSSSTRTIQTVAASTTRPVTQFTGAASVEKPVYGLLAMGAFAALL